MKFNKISHLPGFETIHPHKTETYKSILAVEKQYNIKVQGCGWYRSGDLYILITRPNKIKNEILVEIWDRFDPRDLMTRLARIEEH